MNFTRVSDQISNTTHNIREFVINYRYSLIIYCTAFLTMFVMFCAFTIEVNCIGKSTTVYICKTIADIALLTLPYWLIGKKWRWTIIFPALFVAFVFLINLWYARFWGEILPLSCLTMTQNVNETLIESISGVTSSYDFWFIIPPLILIGIVIQFWKRQYNEGAYSKRIKWHGFIISIAIFLFVQVGLTLRIIRYNHLYPHDGLDNSFWEITGQRYSSQSSSPVEVYKNNGLVLYMCRVIQVSIDVTNLMRPLTENEEHEISDYIQRRPLLPLLPEFEPNKDKNIIFIIVESLNAEVINRTVNNVEITPTLNSLIASEGTIYTLQMVSQLNDGSSGDGQHIYHTGLLPLRHGSTALLVTPKIEYSPLSAQLARKNTVAIFADDGKTWNQRIAFMKFGFSNVITSAEFNNQLNAHGNDGAMFDHGFDLLKDIPQPFTAAFVTISMHVPFRDKGVDSKYDWLYDATELDNAEIDYLRMTAYFDYELGKFIDKLKAQRRWNNTILIVASDHAQKLGVSRNRRIENGDDMPIVFIAANTGMTRHIDKPVGQIDVFPTVLQIAGVENPTFAGVGVSMLDSAHTSFSDIETAQRISQLILCGNYFEEKSIKD